jgi:pyruvate/2-oxoglutarate/acetoin dehydrogenase E1 component
MREITYLQAINEAVDEEMARDSSVFLFGEDVRKWGAPLGEFGGLFDKYGPKRVLDTPISETGMVGAAIGSAAAGLRPIVHIMMAEFLTVCWSDIFNAMCKPRYMSGGKIKFPATIMTYSGGGISAAGEHSGCLDGMEMSIPGLKIVHPSTPYDAKGLIKSAIRDDNPVQVFYHKSLLLGGIKGEVPEEEYTIPLGKADVKRSGSDVTVVATALMLHRALKAAEKLQAKGISIEVVDPRSLAPLDKETIFKSLEKTGKLVIMVEEPKTGSSASEIAAVVVEEAFDLLKAPVKRVCGPDTAIPFTPALEKVWMPDEDNLIKAVTEIM